MVAGGMQDGGRRSHGRTGLDRAQGLPAGIETTVSDVLGRPARRFTDFVAENRDAFVQ
jgi:hypothetical protein